MFAINPYNLDVEHQKSSIYQNSDHDESQYFVDQNLEQNIIPSSEEKIYSEEKNSIHSQEALSPKLIAKRALTLLQKLNKSQTIIVTGESGAGKTYISKVIIVILNNRL